MNLKEKWKRFWTLNVHNHEGFTLVELIIVIAILAILSGVAVVGYSSYVTKANMQADRTLIAEIENALLLAGYSDSFAEGDSFCITLSTSGVVNANKIQEGSTLDLVMDDAFGTNWRETLKLKYNSWGNNGLFSNLTPDAALSIKESSYMTGNRQDKLLKDVETLTNMAGNLMEGMDLGTGQKTLSEMFGKDVLNEVGAQYGIDTEDWTEADWDAWGKENQTAYSNLLVLAAANEAEKSLADDTYQMSGASTVILTFSSLYAYAAVDEGFSATLDTYLDKLNDGEVTDVDSGAAWYSALMTEAGDGYADYLEKNNEALGSDQAEVDQYGFMSILAGLGNPSADQADKIAADLNNANLFTDGVVNEMYQDFLDGVDVVSGMYIGDSTDMDAFVSDGEVAILITQKDSETVIVNTLPG